MKNKNIARNSSMISSASEVTVDTQEEGSDRNHPVLARMMRALKSQKKSTSNNDDNKTESEEIFVSKKSFAASNNKLFGRQSQLKQLKELMDQLSHSSNQNASFLALVHGKSGSGKSSLIDAFVKTLFLLKNPVLFTAGKFDQLKTHLPYAALIKAANDLTRKALRGPHAETIKARFRDELGPDIDLLATIVEELSVLSSHQDKKKSSTIGLAGQAITRFKLLLRSFMRSIASQETPVILFFDDLQWADDATMEMLKALLTDKLSNHVMLILAYRDDEMNAGILQKYFSVSALDDESQQEQQQQQQLSSYLTNVVHRTEIEVPSLDVHALNQTISAALNMNPEVTVSLTNIIMNKTQGNPFYALNFLDMLRANDMIQRDEETESWEWDDSIILRQTDVSDNLAKILEAKILRLPEKVRSILQLAAFIGHDFAANVLTTIVHEEQDMIEGEYSFDLFEKDVIQQWIVDALSLALEEGLVELSANESEGTYKFSHDRIQHCLYKDLMPDDVERRLLHQRIGKLIWNTISTKDSNSVDDWELFLAADNLNRGPKFVDDDGDRVEMVELNVRAGKLAASKAAFLVGVEYLRSGDKLITDDTFVENNYDVCMELWCVAADMELTVGEFGRSSELAAKIHKYARETEDHFPAHLAEIKSLAVRWDLKNAMALAFKVLKQMGVKFPNEITPLTVLWEYFRANMTIGRRKPEELMNLPILTDRKKLFALELLSSISWSSFVAGESAKFTFVAVFLRMMTLTLRYGLSDLYAPQAFVGYGVVCCFFGNFETGLTFGGAAQRLLDRFDSQSIAARTQVHYLSFIHPWTHGLNDALCQSFLQTIHNGMLVGDIDFACAASLGWLLCGFNGMVPLDELVRKATRLRLEMEEYGQKGVLHFLVPCLQALRNMLGDKVNNNPAILTGEDMELESFTAGVEESKSKMASFVLVICEVSTAVYYGDWERVQIKMENLGQLIVNAEGYFTLPLNLTLFVWCNYGLYGMTGKKRYRRDGRRYHRQLKKFAKLRSPLSMTACKVLTAAKAVFVKKKPVEECEELFVTALNDLEETKNYWVHSYVADGLADLFLKAGNNEKAAKYLQKSLDCSAVWGAEKKVEFLERKICAVCEEMGSE